MSSNRHNFVTMTNAGNQPITFIRTVKPYSRRRHATLEHAYFQKTSMTSRYCILGREFLVPLANMAVVSHRRFGFAAWQTHHTSFNFQLTIPTSNPTEKTDKREQKAEQNKQAVQKRSIQHAPDSSSTHPV